MLKQKISKIKSFIENCVIFKIFLYIILPILMFYLINFSISRIFNIFLVKTYDLTFGITGLVMGCFLIYGGIKSKKKDEKIIVLIIGIIILLLGIPSLFLNYPYKNPPFKIKNCFVEYFHKSKYSTGKYITCSGSKYYYDFGTESSDNNSLEVGNCYKLTIGLNDNTIYLYKKIKCLKNLN